LVNLDAIEYPLLQKFIETTYFFLLTVRSTSCRVLPSLFDGTRISYGFAQDLIL
jgi:hypothetical protein